MFYQTKGQLSLMRGKRLVLLSFTEKVIALNKILSALHVRSNGRKRVALISIRSCSKFPINNFHCRKCSVPQKGTIFFFFFFRQMANITIFLHKECLVLAFLASIRLCEKTSPKTKYN